MQFFLQNVDYKSVCIIVSQSRRNRPPCGHFGWQEALIMFLKTKDLVDDLVAMVSVYLQKMINLTKNHEAKERFWIKIGVSNTLQ